MSTFELPSPDAPAEEWGRLAMRIPGWCEPEWDLPSSWLSSPHDLVPDPDHWAWEGWMLRLLGGGASSLWVCAHFDSKDIGIGRACIAFAAANGRWPGGGE